MHCNPPRAETNHFLAAIAIFAAGNLVDKCIYYTFLEIYWPLKDWLLVQIMMFEADV